MRSWRPKFLRKGATIVHLFILLSFISFNLDVIAQKKSPKLVPFMEQGFWGYMNMEGKLEIQPLFEYAGEFQQGLAAVKSHGKYGFIDTKGAFMVKEAFDWAGDFHDSRACVMKDIRGEKKYGYINSGGGEIIGMDFQEARGFIAGKAAVKFNGAWGMIDKNGNYVIDPMFEEMGEFNEGFAPVKMDGVWGFVNENGDISAEMMFEEAREYSSGVAVVKYGGMWGAVDKTGQFIFEPRYAVLHDYSEGLAVAATFDMPNGPYGYVDIHGELVIAPEFNLAFPFNGLARVKQGNFYGYINRKGEFIMPAQFTRARDFSEGKAAVWTSGSLHITKKETSQENEDGAEQNITESQDQEQQTETKDHVVYRGFGYIDAKANWVIKPRFAKANEFKNGLAVIEIEGLFDYVKEDGSLLTGLRLKPVQEGELWGYQNERTKEWLIDAQYDEAGAFRQGKAKVWISDKAGQRSVGVIDIEGKYVLDPKYSEIRQFKNGFAGIVQGNQEMKMGYINEEYKVVVKPQYNAANNFSEGMALVAKKVKGSMKFGYIDENGKVLVKLKYDDGEDFSGGKAKVKKGDKWIYIDKEGTKLKEG